MDFSLPAVKAALHRGRTQLRELADEPDDLPHPELSEADRDRLGAYVAHFNARDFDAIRAMIADDVRLDLVNKTRLNGKAEVSRYFGNYSKVSDWHLVPGLVEGRPAILVFDPGEPRLRAEIFHAAAMVGRQGRHHPRFPPRALHHRWRRISRVRFRRSSAGWPPIDPGDPRDGRNRSQITSTIILAIRAISELWCMVAEGMSRRF